MDFLHNINIVKALKTGLGPADIFQILQRTLLAVHIVRAVARIGQQSALVQHSSHIGIVCGAVLHHDVGRTFEGQRVDRDVFGIQGDGFAQACFKAFHRVPRQARNQIHIDVRVPCCPGSGEAVHDILRGVTAADVAQNLIREGLRVDGNTRGAILFDDAQLLGVGAVGAAGLDGVLIEFR